MKHALLIDGNSIMFACQHGGNKLSAGDQETTAIFGFLNTLRRVREQFPDGMPMVLWDAPNNWRKTEDSTYKGNRKNPKMMEVKKRVHEQTPILRELLTLLGIWQFEADTFEADDIGGFLTRKFNQGGKMVTLITGDRDWLQLVGPLTSWWDHRTEELVDDFGFQHKTGFEHPVQFVQAKALQGDTSDNLPGVGGIGEKAAIAIMEEFGGVLNLKKRWEEVEPTVKPGHRLSRYKKKISAFLNSSDAQERFKRNLRFMTLRSAQIDNLQTIKAVYQEQQFKQAIAKLSFQSILMDYPNWISVFE